MSAAATASGSTPTSRPSRTPWTSTCWRRSSSVAWSRRGGRPRLRHRAAPAPGCASTASEAVDGVDLHARDARGRALARRAPAAGRGRRGGDRPRLGGLRPGRHVARRRAPGRPAARSTPRRTGWPARAAPTCWSATTRTSSWPPGMPTHFDSASGEPVAIETHLHLLSDHIDAALAAGWELRRAARAPDRRRLARAQAEVGEPARPADGVRARLAQARRLAAARARDRAVHQAVGQDLRERRRGSWRRCRPGSASAAASPSAPCRSPRPRRAARCPVSCSILTVSRRTASIIAP